MVVELVVSRLVVSSLEQLVDVRRQQVAVIVGVREFVAERLVRGEVGLVPVRTRAEAVHQRSRMVSAGGRSVPGLLVHRENW